MAPPWEGKPPWGEGSLPGKGSPRGEGKPSREEKPSWGGELFGQSPRTAARAPEKAPWEKTDFAVGKGMIFSGLSGGRGAGAPAGGEGHSPAGTAAGSKALPPRCAPSAAVCRKVCFPCGQWRDCVGPAVRGSAGQALPARRKKAGDAPQKASPAFFRERPSGRGAAPGPRGRGGAGGGKKAAGKKVRRVLRGGEGALPKTRKQPPPQWGGGCRAAPCPCAGRPPPGAPLWFWQRRATKSYGCRQRQGR